MSEPLHARAHPQDPRATYYAEAHSWAQDSRTAPARAARIAWIVAGVAASVACLEAMALIAMMPLKTVVPYTLLVDRNTGFAQVLAGGQVPQVGAQAALEQSLLAQYVIAREGFDPATAQGQYARVALWSAGAARAQYLALMPATNPDSPQNHVAHGGALGARVESVSLTGPGVALVRFATRASGDGAPVLAGDAYWVAVVHYRFSGQPMALEDRLANPLGFQVTQYIRDQEAPPVANALPAPVVTPLGAMAPAQTGAAPDVASAMQASETPTVITPTPSPKPHAPRYPGYASGAQPWGSPHQRRMMLYGQRAGRVAQGAAEAGQ